MGLPCGTFSFLAGRILWEFRFLLFCPAHPVKDKVTFSFIIPMDTDYEQNLFFPRSYKGFPNNTEIIMYKACRSTFGKQCIKCKL